MILCEVLPPFVKTLSRMVPLWPQTPRDVAAGCAVCAKVLWLGSVGILWLWALRKLLESSWGLVGLGLSGGKKKAA